MDDLQDARDRVHNRKKTIILGCLGLPILLVALVSAVFGIALYFQARSVSDLRVKQERLLADLDTVGCPVSWDAWLTRNPPVVDADNGAERVGEAIAALRMIPPEDDPLVPYVGHLESIPPHQRYSEESQRAMAAFVVANQSAFDLYARGMARSAIAFPGLGPDTSEASLDGHYERLRFLRDSLRVAADTAITSGDPVAIRKTLHALAMAPGLYARIPVHGAFHARMQAVMDYCVAVERAFNQSDVSEELLAETQVLLTKAQPIVWFQHDRIPWRGATYPPPPRDYLMGEVLQQRSSAILAMSPLPDSIMVRLAGREYEACKLRLLQNVKTALQVSESTGAEYRSTWDACWAAAGAAGNEMTRGIETAPFWDIGMLVHARTYQRLARIAVALEQFRMRHGAFPETLEALEPDAYGGSLLDPWDGNPLRYWHDRQGFLLYSVGGNLVDDGGVHFADRKEQKERGDIVFAVHPKPAVLGR